LNDLLIDWLIDWLVFNANFISISAILWCWLICQRVFVVLMIHLSAISRQEQVTLRWEEDDIVFCVLEQQA
jgi:hypothetical protein